MLLYSTKQKTKVGAKQSCKFFSCAFNTPPQQIPSPLSFKLRLRPKSMKLQMNGMRFSGIPKTKTAVDVFGDFLGYLFRCTRAFIEDTHANGVEMCKSVEHGIQFVLSHPNGWEGAQQSKMRRAAIIGGLIPDTDEGKARIRFVTEGEASLHACVLNGLAADVLSVSGRYRYMLAKLRGRRIRLGMDSS